MFWIPLNWYPFCELSNKFGQNLPDYWRVGEHDSRHPQVSLWLRGEKSLATFFYMFWQYVSEGLIVAQCNCQPSRMTFWKLLCECLMQWLPSEITVNRASWRQGRQPGQKEGQSWFHLDSNTQIVPVEFMREKHLIKWIVWICYSIIFRDTECLFNFYVGNLANQSWILPAKQQQL